MTEALAMSGKVELDQQIEFRRGPEIDLGLKDPTRKIVHRGDVSRKSSNSLTWVPLHLILLDNYLVIAEERIEQRCKNYAMNQVRHFQMYLIHDQAILLDFLVPQSPVQSQVVKASSFISRAVS